MKIYRLLFGLILYSQVALSTSSRDLEEISIYSPYGRFGFNGSIVNINLENVQEGPRDRYFSLDNDGTEVSLPVSKSHLVFTANKQWRVDRSNGTRDHTQDVLVRNDLNPIINYRISTYAIARLTLDSYLECGINHSLFNSFNVILNPNDQACRLGIGNAYYERNDAIAQRRIELCGAVNDQSPLPTARFFDIVSHETGHSILDALRRSLYGHTSPSPFATLHESFGDLSTFFASVRLAKIFGRHNQVVNFLRGPNINLCLALNFDGRGHCLRNSQDVSASCESHDSSRIFTNFYLKSMGNFFSHCQPTSDNAYTVVNIFQKLLVRSVISLATPTDLYDIGLHVVHQVEICNDIAVEDRTLINKILKNQLSLSQHLLQSCRNVRTETSTTTFHYRNSDRNSRD